MSNSLPTIMIVDDSPSDLALTSAILESNFSIIKAKSGSQAINHFIHSENIPKVVLMDASMPEMDGYTTCKEIKKLDQANNTEIIFLSGHSSIAEKLLGYDAGASGYLTKPFQPLELIEKIKLSVARFDQKENFEMQSKYAMETAMSAIMDAGEQATVIHFMRQCLICPSVEELVSLICSSVSSFGLTNTVELRTPWKKIHSSSNGSTSPLEIELLTALQHIGKITQRGKRLILNFGDISQFIKNMPEENPDKCGRLRDHLALILEAANSRLQSLILAGDIKELIIESNKHIQEFNENQSLQKQNNIAIMDEMHDEIQSEFFTYGLTEEQEKILLSIIGKYSEKIFYSYEKSLKTDAELLLITSKLKKSIDRFF
jgi:DNA-binding response OmpR family regulator